MRRLVADMSEIGEYYKERREANKKHRYAHHAAALVLLNDANIHYESKNDGLHLVIAARWDLWPSTGKWRDRKTNTYNHGVKKLIAIIKKD